MVDTKDDTPLAKKIQDYVAKTVGKTSAEYACLGIESILPSATTEGGINAEGLADEICDFYRVTSKYVGEEGYKSSKEYWVKTIKRHLSHTTGGELKPLDIEAIKTSFRYKIPELVYDKRGFRYEDINNMVEEILKGYGTGGVDRESIS